MIKGVFKVIAGLIAVVDGQYLYAQNQQKELLEVSLNIGVQKENFTWSIAGNVNGEQPNILSELKWISIKSTRIGVDFKWKILDRFTLLGDYARSSITSGMVYDTDFDGDNRTSISYSEKFSVDKGALYDCKIAIGYKLAKTKDLVLEACIGYGIGSQKYLISRTGSDYEKVGEYATKRTGPFIGMQANFGVFKNTALKISVRYHQINFEGKGDWTLVEGFQHPVSFVQTAKGYGINVSPMLNFQVCRKLSLGVITNYDMYETGNGIDKLFLKSGAIQKTKFNNAKRSMMAYGFFITVRI